jgi:Na+/H+ antiporter NhaD/arsenite permease-like protein
LRAKILAGLAVLAPCTVRAGTLDGSALGAWWALPFAGLLLSIALCPLFVAGIWHRHYGKIASFWAFAFLVPAALLFGPQTALYAAAHALLEEFLPFILLITALFVVSGGIYVEGNLHGTPARNTALLALGTALASVMGTTGAAMLLVRPLIRANDNRRHAAHIMVFFIFLVANAGGSLTPLGDPPLFLGFLQGVDFFWTLRHIFPETLFLCLSLLALFYLIDSWYCRHREEILPADPTPDSPLVVRGKVNFLLLAAVVGLVLMSGLWKPGIAWEVLGVSLDLPGLARDGGLILVILLSLALTPAAARAGNAFSWAPVLEVGKLFAAIFITMIPAIAMLRAGEAGAFAPVIRAVTGPAGQPIDAMYFWATGLLSSFLDNAPTYLVFFNTAGGDAHALMTTLASTLAAISCGAVFMGANSYIGNAPNMMVKAIAEERGIKMPSFFGYMLWSCAVLVPLFFLMTFLFFR